MFCIKVQSADVHSVDAVVQPPARLRRVCLARAFPNDWSEPGADPAKRNMKGQVEPRRQVDASRFGSGSTALGSPHASHYALFRSHVRVRGYVRARARARARRPTSELFAPLIRDLWRTRTPRPSRGRPCFRLCELDDPCESIAR
jgi:hypothetical protein